MADTPPQPGQPMVFRNATVLTMDDARTVLTNADVLVSGERHPHFELDVTSSPFYGR